MKYIVYDGDTKNSVERFVQTWKDRLECFDDYFPCMKEDCECEHVKNWIRHLCAYLQLCESTCPWEGRL